MSLILISLINLFLLDCRKRLNITNIVSLDIYNIKCTRYTTSLYYMIVEPNKMDTGEWMYSKINGQYLKNGRQRSGQKTMKLSFSLFCRLNSLMTKPIKSISKYLHGLVATPPIIINKRNTYL